VQQPHSNLITLLEQAQWRMFVCRRRYLLLKKAAVVAQKNARVVLAKKAARDRRQAIQTLRKL
jgi:hypothetical protein